jgi:AcrR family transcriptional regulator
LEFRVTAQVPRSPRVEARRAATTREILDAAWELATASGLEALSLREIAARVGMQAPSLYSYFANKAAILDALFADGYQQLADELAAVHESLPSKAPPRRRLVALLTAWIDFCRADQARYRLMFTAAVPGWQPSADAYAWSVVSFERMTSYVADAGITDPGDVDLCTALSAGLVAQQMANDPTGDRWTRRAEDIVDMLLLHISTRDRRIARQTKGTS